LVRRAWNKNREEEALESRLTEGGLVVISKLLVYVSALFVDGHETDELCPSSTSIITPTNTPSTSRSSVPWLNESLMKEIKDTVKSDLAFSNL